ncbi:RHS repeat-associated core domain-containing protein [Ruficoccus sp. ZRK36]|uniref:RHS repeat domain-containing protein n=1 Tax=Ruficoccus sp. ZRK36 TaxID=2866311 RepID=UPI001C73BFBD|nr:RHS repeat-associated core domain-containing protein [Ruficoccus sp. ZRK36]QYY37438.1 RHS repeat-associated core domain-containing protein [Ruficoccus sp. ZRK36]
MAEETGSVYLAPNPENFVYDADGNLKLDGRWSYSWDAENRLIAMQPTTDALAAGVPNRKLEFSYDAQGRRYKKTVLDWSDASSAYVVSSATLYLYDGWNVIAERSATDKYYLWGLDLSGSLQGAGGVGGLLEVSVTDETAGTHTYAPAYDGNGNVMAYVDASSGEVAAQFEYGPFGEPLRATGSAADELTYRFSTKYTDPESGLLYYGYRYYSPGIGRWPSRDPIGEDGGVNLYGMVNNDPINYWDVLGRWPNFLSCFGVTGDASEYPDPRETCLTSNREGFYRHCVNTCLLSRCLSTINPVLGPIIAEQVALEAGGDRGTGNSDTEANEHGVGNTYGVGTCESMCLNDFNSYVAENCCSTDEMLDKSDSSCCDEE